MLILTGTSLFKLKDEFKETYVPFARSPDKHTFYTDRKITDKDYIKSLEKHNNQFVETVRFQNLYNRLITYDANELHKANSFECDQSRLTLVFFIRDIKNVHVKLEKHLSVSNERWKETILRIKRMEHIMIATSGTAIVMLIGLLVR